MLLELSREEAATVVPLYLLAGLGYIGAAILIPVAVIPSHLQEKVGFTHMFGRRVACSSTVGRLMLGGWGVMWLYMGIFATLEILRR